MHVCVQSRLHFQPRCLQVCAAAAAASLLGPLIEISIAGGLLMASTCVSHYSKLRILLSKSRIFLSHFVISRRRRKLSAIRDSRETPGGIL